MCDTSFDESRFLSDISSSSDSDSEYDLSDPEAERCSSPDFNESSGHSDCDRDDSTVEGVDIQFHVSSPDIDSSSSNGDDGKCHTRGRARGRGSRCARNYARGRGRNRGRGRGRGRSRGRGSGHDTGSGRSEMDKEEPLQVCDLSSKDTNVPQKHDFKPLRPVGPHLHSHAVTYSPAALFKLYFDSDIVQKICDATNEYAERNKEKCPTMYGYFSKFEPDDFFSVVGILIHLGYRRIPRYRLMWQPTSLCYDPLISSVMSRNKFESYLSFLHLVDQDTEKQLKDQGDKLCKVRPLNDHLQKFCMKLYQPNREISIDERMVRSKARFSFRQYIRNKPVKWGFKLWCLCDSHNGYTCDFSVYRGKNGEVRSSNGLGYDVVMSLMKDYFGQGLSLYIDNFYTSPTLVNDQYIQGVHVTGTLDCTRVGVPSEVSVLKKKFSPKTIPRGNGSYVRDGNCVYTVWKDTKCVSVMSNEFPGHSESKVIRNVKDKDGKTEKKEVPIPVIIYNYNRFMNVLTVLTNLSNTTTCLDKQESTGKLCSSTM